MHEENLPITMGDVCEIDGVDEIAVTQPLYHSTAGSKLDPPFDGDILDDASFCSSLSTESSVHSCFSAGDCDHLTSFEG